MGLEDKANNTKDEVVGKAKKKIGETTDNQQWQVEGELQEDKGKLGQAAEKVKDVFRD